MFRSDFPIFSTHPDLVYLDSASTTQKPARVITEMSDHMSAKNANIHRGAYELSELSETIYEGSKKKVARWISAKSPGEIIYTYSATIAFNYLAATLVHNKKITKESVILLSEIDHHANIVPWQIAAAQVGAEIRWIRIGSDGRLDLDSLRSQLTPDITILSLSGASNVTGEITPLAAIRDIITQIYTPETRPLWIVDGSQRVPHIETRVADLGIDFFVFTAHKVFSDTGLGVLYARLDLLRQLDPAWCGGGAINWVSHTGYEAAGLPFRHEPGTPHIIGAGSLGSALDYLDSIGGYEALSTHERDLVMYTFDHLRGFAHYQEGSIRLLGPQDPSEKMGVFTFDLGSIHPNDMAEYFADHGVAVRSGHHCTEPLHQTLGIRGSLRMSFSLYNTRSDIDRFFSVFERGLRELAR